MHWLLLALAVWFFFLPLLLMTLWNLTLPDIFGLPEIRFWQALRLMLISAILFGQPIIHYTAAQ